MSAASATREMDTAFNVAAAEAEEDGLAHSLSVVLCRFADTSGYIQYLPFGRPFGRPFGSFDF